MSNISTKCSHKRKVEGVREEQGSGLVFVFDDDINMPSNFESNFLSNNVNKTKLE